MDLALHNAYGANQPIDGFNTDRDAFLGVYGSIERPKNVLDGKPGNSMASGGAVIGSHYIRITLAPGQSQSLIFLLGYTENPQEEKWESPGVINKIRARQVMARFSTDRQVDEALTNLRDYWESLLSAFRLESPDEKLNRMVNIWNQYQCMVAFDKSRSASYFESGESFQTFGPSEGPIAESVFIGGMFVKYAREYASICRRTARRLPHMRRGENLHRASRLLRPGGS